MDQHLFDQILDCLGATNDALVITHRDQPFVVMPFARYQQGLRASEALAQLTQDELLEKINHDIAVWHAGRKADDIDTPAGYGSIASSVAAPFGAGTPSDTEISVEPVASQEGGF